ncbi:MAG: molybdopterin-dependent oxidoreductase, partial [Parasporobacterium sp.]|nr:molybdopterin-dependent oxidoreductase [Parasporobacterium sp.]
RGLYDKDFLDRCCIGFDPEHMPEGADPDDSYVSYLTGVRDGVVKSPSWAEQITGIPAQKITELALKYAGSHPAAVVQGLGHQRHAYGEQAVRGGIMLSLICGNAGISGGHAGGHGGYLVHAEAGMPIPENPYGRKIPCFCWTEAVDHGHRMTSYDGVKSVSSAYSDTGHTGTLRLDSDIKMIFNIASNTLINQHSDINATAKLLKDTSKCEFIVTSDIFMTASAMYSDLVLPATSFLENDNFTPPWRFNEYYAFNNKLAEPVGESRFEYEWMSELAYRLGIGDEFTGGRTCEEWLRAIYAELREKEPEMPGYDEFKKMGIYRFRPVKPVIAFEKECRDPERYPFKTTSGKIEIYSDAVAKGRYKEYFPAIPGYVDQPEGFRDPLTAKYPLQLIGWHTKRRAHSVHDNNHSMDKLDPNCLWIHPGDADVRGISDGDMVIVRNDRGTVQIPVMVTERIMKGVTAMAQGAWYTPDESGTDKRGCINVLTSLHPTPYAFGNPQHTNLVEVVKYEK